MQKKVVLSSTAKAKLSDLLEYLEHKWSGKVKDDFIRRLDQSVIRSPIIPKVVLSQMKSKGSLNV